MKKLSAFLVGIYVLVLFGSVVPVAEAHYDAQTSGMNCGAELCGEEGYGTTVNDNEMISCGEEYKCEEADPVIDPSEQVSWENCQRDENLCELDSEYNEPVCYEESEEVGMEANLCPSSWDVTYEPESYDCYEEEGQGGHFSDVCTYEENFYPLEYLYEKGVFSGNDGKFQKHKILSRVELLKIAYKVKGITPVFDKRFSFKDVSSSEWYAPYVSQALKDKVVKGKDDKLFHPNDPVTKAEQVKIVFSVLGISPVIDDSEVDWDIDQKHWVVPYLKAAQDRNFLNHLYPGEGFYPDEPLQRINSVPLLFKVLVSKESGIEKFSWRNLHFGDFTHFEEKLSSSSAKIGFDHPKYMAAIAMNPKDILELFDLFDDDSLDIQSELRGMEPEERRVMKLFFEDFSLFMDGGEKILRKYMADESILLSHPGYGIEATLDSVNITINSVDKETFKKNMEDSYQQSVSLLEFLVNSEGIRGFFDFMIRNDPPVDGEIDENAEIQRVQEAFQSLRNLLTVLQKPLEVTFGEPITLAENTFTPVHTNTKEILEGLVDQLDALQIVDFFEPFLESSAFNDSYLMEINKGKKVLVVTGVNLENPDHVHILETLSVK